MRFGERIYEKIFAGARPSWWDGFPFVSLRRRVLIGFCVLRVTNPRRTRLRIEFASRSTSTAPVLLNASAYKRVLEHALFRPGDEDGAHVLD